MENIQVNTKLTINLREGVIEAEGSEEFVRTVYDDFKERMSKPIVSPGASKPLLEAPAANDANSEGDEEGTKPSTRKTGKLEVKRASTYKPKFNPKLDVSALEAFYDKYMPSSHSEKILIFGIFLRDELKNSPFSADDIFTCYFAMKHKTDAPEAFWQAFATMKNRTHFIDYTSQDKIEITIAGDNHFNRKLKRAGQNVGMTSLA